MKAEKSDEEEFPHLDLNQGMALMRRLTQHYADLPEEERFQRVMGFNAMGSGLAVQFNLCAQMISDAFPGEDFSLGECFSVMAMLIQGAKENFKDQEIRETAQAYFRSMVLTMDATEKRDEEARQRMAN